MLILDRSLVVIIIGLLLDALTVSSEESEVYTFCDNSQTNVVNVRANSTSFVIQSPNYGNNRTYNLDQSCSIIIASGGEPLVVSFYYNDFDVEYNFYCSWDWLCAYGVKFCGEWLAGKTFQYIVPENNDLTIDFVSDYVITRPGFKITVSVEAAGNSSVDVVNAGVGSNESNIYSSFLTYGPGFNYTNRCLTPVQSTYFVPSYTPPLTTTQTNYFEEINVPMDVYTFCDGSQSNIVNFNAESPPVLIHSPNYGYGSGYYGNNQRCSLIIRSGEESLFLKFRYRSFNLEYQEFCYFDSLCVNGVKFCGSWLGGYTFDYVFPPNSSFTLSFSTDGSVTQTGFEIIVSHETAQLGQSITEARSGRGSSANSINFLNVTYTPDYSYTDRCLAPELSTPTAPNYTEPPATTEATYSENTTSTMNVYTFCDGSQSNIVNFNARSSPVLIHSPNYGYGSGYYGNNQRCSLVIRSGEEPLFLQFQYRHFNLEYQESCYFDSLCVNGVKFCGSWLGGYTFDYVFPPNSSFTLSFSTDGSVTQTGFEIIVSHETAQLGQSITEARSGRGSSANSINFLNVTYTPDYSYTDRCLAPELSTPTAPNYTEPPATTEATYSENTTSTMNVYTFCDGSQSNIVNFNARSSPVLIHSPNYGYGSGYYGNNQRCSLVIRSGEEPLFLQFQYRHFNLEYQESCYFDSLCVNGVKFCGSWLGGYTFDYVFPPNSSFTLSFSTDGSVTQTGFEIIVSHETAQLGQSITEARSGRGSSANSINFLNVTYTPDYSYTDRCLAPELSTPTAPNYTEPPATTEATYSENTTSTMNVYTFCDGSQSNIVNFNARSSPVLIHSPNYGYGSGYYGNNQRCSLVIRSGEEPLFLQFQYRHFNLEIEESCNYDSLCVNGVKFCGSWLGGYTFDYIFPPNSSFTLSFSTDISVVQTGFEIMVSQETAQLGQPIREARSGIGSYYYAINFVNVTYTPDYSYTDRCDSSSHSSSTTPPSTYYSSTGSYTFCNVDDIDEEIQQAITALYTARQKLRGRK